MAWIKTILSAIIWMVLCSTGSASESRLSGISGYWYDSEQPGFGLVITVARPGLAVVTWTTFDLDGDSLALYAEASISGHTLEGNLIRPGGVTFGDFDPADRTVRYWGDLRIEFHSCTDATLTWTSSTPGFVSGQADLERLAFVDGLPCDVETLLPAGLYTGVTAGDGIATPAVGFMDQEGTLWSLERSDDGIPGPASAGGTTWMTIVESAGELGPDGRIAVTGLANRVSWVRSDFQATALDGEWRLEGRVDGTFEWVDPILSTQITQTWTPGAPPGAELISPITQGLLTGTYAVPLRNQFNVTTARLSIDAAGFACIEIRPVNEPGVCNFDGQVTVRDAELGLLGFALRDADDPTQVYRGRGWMVLREGREELTLVGPDENGAAFALRARFEN